jgi:hypothetical protein
MARSDRSQDERRDDADVEDVVDAINANTVVEVAALQAEVRELRTMIAAVVGLDAMTQVLENGFGTISDQLRRLVPASNAGDLKEPIAEHIAELRESLETPDVSYINRLEVGYTSVPFIGAVGDPRQGRNGGAA